MGNVGSNLFLSVCYIMVSCESREGMGIFFYFKHVHWCWCRWWLWFFLVHQASSHYFSQSEQTPDVPGTPVYDSLHFGSVSCKLFVYKQALLMAFLVFRFCLRRVSTSSFSFCGAVASLPSFMGWSLNLFIPWLFVLGILVSFFYFLGQNFVNTPVGVLARFQLFVVATCHGRCCFWFKIRLGLRWLG